RRRATGRPPVDHSSRDVPDDDAPGAPPPRPTEYHQKARHRRAGGPARARLSRPNCVHDRPAAARGVAPAPGSSTPPRSSPPPGQSHGLDGPQLSIDGPPLQGAPPEEAAEAPRDIEAHAARFTPGL